MRKYYHLLLGVVLVIVSGVFLFDFFKGADDVKVKSLKDLVESKTTAEAILDSTYNEKTIKIAGVETKTYESGYTFKVEEKEYKGTTNLDAAPTELTLNVKYLSSDPSVNSANPEKELKSEL